MSIGQAEAIKLALGNQGSCLGGWWKKVYPVAGPVRGHSSETPGPWTPILYIQHLRTPTATGSPCFLSLAFFSFLHLAFFTSHPPPHTRLQCALIATRDTGTSAVTISRGKGSGNLPNSSGSGTGRLSTKWGIHSCIFLWRHSSHFSLKSFPFSLRYLQYTGFLALENWLGHQNCTRSLVQGLGDKSVEAFPIGSWAFSATRRTVFAPATAPQVADFSSPQITVYFLFSCYVTYTPVQKFLVDLCGARNWAIELRLNFSSL